MNREKNFILTTAVGLFFFSSLSFGQFVDNFEYYFVNQQLSCQNPIYWTTWSSLPCDSVEDPYLSTNHSYSGSKSVRIVQNNDLVKPLDLPDYCYISFWVYIPTSKSGYFNLLSGFTPNPFQWGMECFFDVGGGGRLINGPVENFSWTPNTWQFVEILVDLISDEAKFWFEGTMVSSWQWSRGGLINLQLDAIDFFGATANDEMYFDDFIVRDGCLSCTSPNVPTNLTAEEIFNPYPQVLLHWQDNSMIEYAFYIIRKNRYPNDPGSYEYIGTTTANITELVDSMVIVDSIYTYGVVAHGSYGYSDTSNTATITVDPVTTVNHVKQPLIHSLKQNYPNPFNPTTTIKYQIPEFSLVTIKVYDVLGNKIAVLINDEKPAGSYEVEFDATELSSGIYFYQLRVSDFVETKKMILMK